ncbi:HNH endonuclease [Flavobacterium anhuiense]|uniref:HNH endonuclease n=1 Tax=Flavobacterium anhuiense TaxID=459526 RepID=UPI003D970533
MRRIKYPYSDNIQKDKFKDDYYDLLKNKFDVVKIDTILKKIDSDYTLKKILTDDFPELMTISKKIKNSKYEKKIKPFFTKKSEYLYDNCQLKISSFLMEKNMELNTCHYCNIDFINITEEHYQFNSIKDFVLYAPYDVLMLIKEIKKDTAKRIIKYRKRSHIIKWSNLLNDSIYDRLYKMYKTRKSQGLDLRNIIIKRNHFTLDHVLPKSEYNFLSLSIFNLVPSCNSCNSKFKHQKEFTVNNELAKICPSSHNFEWDDLVNFKLKFDINDPEFERKINEIKEVKDIEIKIDNTYSLLGVDEFIEIFKLKSRYEFHKYISLEMIENRKLYSDSNIKEISDFFLEKGILKSVDSLKKDIFGKELFEENNAPFEKYKRDIARQLGLIK